MLAKAVYEFEMRLKVLRHREQLDDVSCRKPGNLGRLASAANLPVLVVILSVDYTSVNYASPDSLLQVIFFAFQGLLYTRSGSFLDLRCTGRRLGIVDIAT